MQLRKHNFILRKANRNDFIKISKKDLFFVYANFELLNFLANILVVLNERFLHALQKLLVAGDTFQDDGLAFLQFSEKFTEVSS